MRKSWPIMFAAALAWGPWTAKGATLAEGGKSEYVIVVGRAASPPEAFAAEELQKYLRKICGATLPIVQAGEERPKRMIRIRTPANTPGAEREGEGAASAFSQSETEHDAFQVETRDSNLLLTGSNPRASLYAVYDLLEQEFGVFWPGPFSEEEIVPCQKEIALPKVKYRKSATFKYRGYATNEDPRIIDWMAKRKLNRVGFRFQTCDSPVYQARLLPEIQKRGILLSAATHGFQYFIPSAKYLAEHPEYYSLPAKSDKRIPRQFCTFNKDALKIYTDNYVAFMERHPEIDSFHPSQDDGYGWCECPLCGNERWEIISAQARASDKLLHAVNSVAAEAATRFPAKKIVYQGYVATAPVPKQAKPLPNVIAMLAFFERTASDMSATNAVPYYSCPDINGYYRRVIQEWGELVPEVFIYEYYCGRSSWEARPMVLSGNIKNSLKYFADHRVAGLVSQGSYNWWRPYLLNHYLLAELLWNVDADPAEVTKSFCARYFGKAAEAMQQYFSHFEASAFAECELDLKNAERAAENARTANHIRYQQILFGYDTLARKIGTLYLDIHKLARAKEKEQAMAKYEEIPPLEQATQRYIDASGIQLILNSPAGFYELSKILRENYPWLVKQTASDPQTPPQKASPRAFIEADGE
ncbi:MAG: DUF4838 domain-containing protein [Verrucomicrobiae bacterium]|nr:DUF4838 domain-containing protein [Verrucomicrobiae bacterium]